MTEPKIEWLIEQGALFVINHSGGKDSQAMAAYLYGLVPAKQLVVIHAHLREVEWDGTWEHIQENNFGLPTYMVESAKSFFDSVPLT